MSVDSNTAREILLSQNVADAITGECDFSDAARAMYTSDASNYRQVPVGVVYPRSRADIVATHALCREQGLNVLMRGGGTSQNGQCVNEAVILDCSRHLTNVLAIDPQHRTATVEPGIICDSLKHEAEQHGLTFGPDPATHSRCTLGGMIGNNSCGPRSMLAGKTVENVIELDILTSDGIEMTVGPTTDSELETYCQRNDRVGEIYRELRQIRDQYADRIRARYPDIKRRVSGYNLDQLLPENGFNVARALVGSEGTCVTILQARVALIENPKHRQLFVLGFDDIFIAGDSVPEIMPFTPIAMEGLDWTIIGGLNDRGLRQREVALLPEGRAWLLVELASSTTDELAQLSDRFQQAMHTSERVRSVVRIATADNASIWAIREQGASATALSLDPEQPDPVVGWEDTAVDPYQLGDYLREFQALVDRFGYRTSLYGHFGDGCIHARITFDTRTQDGVADFRRFGEELAKTVIRYGGSLSGEHGDGQAKAEFLPLMFGEELMQAFERFKRIWDPEGRMNPGKLINAYRVDENLRFGPDYDPKPVETTLQFVEDPGGFNRTSERCIGMGKCRALNGAMCPSYQVTREERYSPRGRAHLLHEIVRGEVLSDGWNDPFIADSLEHCLSCKACKSECPTAVDIAMYKSEFMSRYYAHRRRPIADQLVANLGNWLPVFSRFARLSNTLADSPLQSLIKSALGLHSDARLPKLANRSFRSSLPKGRDQSQSDIRWFGLENAEPVILWIDSFNDHYRPHVIEKAIDVLVGVGARAGVAGQHFCCGRPLYEACFLERGRKQLLHILDHFLPALPAQAKVVVLEPSCLSVFHDELSRLLPDHPHMQSMRSRVCTLGDFLNSKGYQPSRKMRSAIVHWHCHHKSMAYTPSDRQLLQACFEHLHEPESGCCGMAGIYGLRSKTRHIGQALWQRRLQPAISGSESDTLLVSDGFSCSSQIKNGCGQNVLHPVEVLASCR